MTTTEAAAAQNARKIRDLMVAGSGSAVLCRQIVAGPSGQRKQLRIARVCYTADPLESEWDFTICDSRGDVAGYARPTADGRWAIYEDCESDGIRWRGYASSLALGADVVINGEHAATANHTHARISRGTWQPARLAAV